jgi:hypothetical protein
MSNIAFLQPNDNGTQPYLGPATVVTVSDNAVTLQLKGDEQVRARLALAFGYAPVVDDEVLVIGNDDGYYVIGVLNGRGPARMSFNGDVELRSVDGVVKLSGGKGVELDAPELSMRANKMSVMARSLMERFGNAYRNVSEMLSVRAGQQHTVVEDTSYTQAKRATLLTEKEVNINGKKINLG